MLAVHFFKVPQFSLGVVTRLLAFIAFSSTMFLMPFYLKFLGLIYLSFALPLSTYYILVCFKLFKAKDGEKEKSIAKQIFAFSILYLFAIFISILVDKFV